MSDGTISKDLVIVGGGPAGLSAAIYASRSLLDAVTLEREALGGQVILTSEIDNYPGVPHADGFSLVDAMRAQAEDLGATIVMDPVDSVERDEATGRFRVSAASASYDAAAVIVAAGATPRHAGFEGEERFAGHGVSYCATCDGMFYRGKHVFVVGGGNSAAEEALFLARLASRVTMVVRKDHLRAQAAIVRELEENERVEILLSTSVVALDGGELPSRVTLRDNVTGETRTLDYEEGSFGVFVLVGRVPETGLVAGLVETDDAGYVVTDDRMATATPGLFVAGDVRSKALRQIVTAAADGAVAATSAASYLGLPVEG
ncbi:NAD(P)/FAD-dependent oxidoreductase [Thermophilibacter mediterraneus]|uniref:NAD(P)/FAD-dependent oxidoreductase n=1 Tax=Thermophilibacter mediterraneus TaxID=1871031 RepID=UPI002357DF23|nr:FAD-dependent oxidoreductase [Thermophilibacter mediterraneus]